MGKIGGYWEGRPTEEIIAAMSSTFSAIAENTHKMCIPPQNNDWDIVLLAARKRLEALQAEVDRFHRAVPTDAKRVWEKNSLGWLTPAGDIPNDG